MPGGGLRTVNTHTNHASPYFPFLSSGLNLSPEKQNRHDIVGNCCSCFFWVCRGDFPIVHVSCVVGIKRSLASTVKSQNLLPILSPPCRAGRAIRAPPEDQQYKPNMNNKHQQTTSRIKTHPPTPLIALYSSSIS